MHVIASLTTISRRLAELPRVLRSIIGQTIPPDEVRIYVSKEPHLLDDGVPSLPVEVQRMLSERVTAHWVPNIGPYRKLLPVLSEFWGRDVVIITFDDDVVYNRRMLERLLWRYTEYRCVVSAKARVCLLDEEGKLRPYQELPFVLNREAMGMNLIPIGNGGVLYHPKFFTHRVFGHEAFETCPTNDDLWFRLNTMLTGTPVFTLGKAFKPFVQQEVLFETNRVNNNSMFQAGAAALCIDLTAIEGAGTNGNAQAP